MANYDERIVLGAMADVASAKKTGEEIGRAAGDAATNAFLASFNAIFDKIPVSNKKVAGSVSMGVKEREALNTLVATATDRAEPSANRRAALKSLISATREYARKTPKSLSAQIAADAAISLGQEAVNVNARLDRQQNNSEMRMANKLQTLQLNRDIARVSSFMSLTSALEANASEMEIARAHGTTRTEQTSSLRRQRSILKSLLNDKYADLRDKDQTEKYSKQLDENTRELRKLAVTQVASSTAITAATAAIGAASVILPSMWGQHVTRNTFDAKTAFNERVTAGGRIGGNVIGGGLGGILGAFLGGPAGAMIGTNLGSTVGGAVGALFGESSQKSWEAHQRTIRDMQARIRANNMYRGAYSTSFGGMVQEMGMASAGDIESMVGNSQTLAARMMFGQVGENEMLMYSLMPNYFAAAMNGASDAELAAAYSQDLNALPPMFRLWAGSAVGGGSAGMAAFAQDAYFGDVLKNAKFAHAVDNAMVGYSGGWQAASVTRGRMNAGYTISAAMEDTANVKEEAGIYDTSSIRPVFIGDMYNGMVSANAYDLRNAVNAKTKVRAGGGTWNMWRSDFESMFGNTANMFHEAQNMLDSRKTKDVENSLSALNEWLQKESITIVVNVDGQKQEEIKIRGEQAARAGKMSVYSRI